MTMPQGKNKDLLVFCTTCTAYLVFALYLVSSYSPVKIFHSKYAKKWVANTFYPIRWNVYTRTPGEPEYRLYYPQNGKLVRADIRPFTPKYIFGIRRDYKIVGEEMSVIMADSMLSRLPVFQMALAPGQDINTVVNADTLTWHRMAIDNVYFLRGRYVITRQMPLTWDEARKHENIARPETVLAVDLTDK